MQQLRLQATSEWPFPFMNKLLDYLKGFFQKPSDTQLAVEELQEAKRNYLAHLSAAEYHQKLAEYYSDKSSRLAVYINRNMSNG